MPDLDPEVERRLVRSFRVVRRVRLALMLVSVKAIALLAWVTQR